MYHLSPLCEPSEYNSISARRARTVWEARRIGMTYKEIAGAMGLSLERVRQIVLKAERRLETMAEIYDLPIKTPLAYGIWHEFDHDGRIGLKNKDYRHIGEIGAD